MFSKTACCIFVTSIMLAGCGGGGDGSSVSSVVTVPEYPNNANESAANESNQPNALPVALFDLQQEYELGGEVLLDASKSYDPAGKLIRYQWRLLSVPENSNAQIDAPSDVKTVLKPDVVGVYKIELAVSSDSGTTIEQHTFEAKQGNLAPVAHAGDKQEVLKGVTITLDGAKSYDPDGSSIAYQWQVVKQPESSSVALSDATIANPSVTFDLAGEYVFSLVVNDGQVNSPASTVTVQVVNGNTAPVANAGTAQSVVVGDTVTLKGAESSDKDGDPLTYQWSFVSVPEGSAVAFNVADSMNPHFTPDVAGTYVAALKVFDGRVYSDVSTVSITAATRNAVPVAVAGNAQTVNTNSRVVLDGSASSDADHDNLRYVWSIVTKPFGSNAQLSDSTIVNPSFLADKAGNYVLQLVVNDGQASSEASRVNISVVTGVNPIPSGAGLLVRGSTFFVIDEQTQKTKLNSHTTACSSASAADIAPDGKWLGVYGSANGLFEIDPYQPLCIKKFDVPKSDGIIYSGMAIDKNGDIYLSDSSTLKHLASDGTLINTYSYSGYVNGVKGIDFSDNGQMYGLSYFNGLELVKVNPDSGSTEFVAKLDIPADQSVHSFYDIDIDDAGNLRTFSTSTGLMYVWDLEGNLLRTVNFDQFSGSNGFLPVSYVGGESTEEVTGSSSSASVSSSTSVSSSSSGSSVSIIREVTSSSGSASSSSAISSSYSSSVQ